jgi:hypothetical protein
MSSTRPNQTLGDWVAIALSPALIMGLVGSLAFFLVEVLYRADGEWKGRLQYILFFFVFGSVLVGRISLLAEARSRAWIYGGILAFLTFLALLRFVDYPEEGGVKELAPLINLFLVVVVWWTTNRITRDCTNVDDDTEAEAQGLLQAAGLEERPEEEPEDEPDQKLTLWQRWKKYREGRAKKRPLGVWVVYFSLAALPLFGLGQALVPLTDPSRRRFCFWLMTVYVACGLGLLMTTCFLGLRRYLRQKRLQMPAAMTGTWLTVGGGLLVALVVLGALLPRPHAEYSLAEAVGARATKRKASQYAQKGGPTGEGEGKPGQARPEGKAGDGQPVQGKQPGKDGQGKAQGKGEQGEPGKEGPKDEGTEKGEKGPESEEKQGEKGEGKGPQGEKAEKGKDGKGKGGSSRSRQLTRVSETMGRIAPVLKWIVFGVLAAVFLFVALRSGLRFLANFSDWVRRLLEAWHNFWANLFGRRKQAAGPAGAGEEREEAEAPAGLPFAHFANPFETGRADALSARELVRYTFAALEAWAREHDLGRRPGETAQELAERVAGEVPALEAEVRRLAALYARAAYGPGGMPANTAEVVRAFWGRLERVAAAPLSA